MKRSRRVVLTMMGTAAVGAVSMGFGPRTDCGPGLDAVPGPKGQPYCRPPSGRGGGFGATPHRLHGGVGGGHGHGHAHAAASDRRLVVTLPRARRWRAKRMPGFHFHTIDGNATGTSPLTTVHALTDRQQIETLTADIDAMCLELVGRAIDDEKYLQRLKIPQAFWPLISESWHRDDLSLYGRLDFSFDGSGPAKLLEYNADTPTSFRSRGVSMDLARAVDRAADHSRPRRPVQFDP